MKRKRFTEEQIIGVLKEHELGAKTADLCRKHGISEATFYNRKLSTVRGLSCPAYLLQPLPAFARRSDRSDLHSLVIHIGG
jgi:Transposase